MSTSMHLHQRRVGARVLSGHCSVLAMQLAAELVGLIRRSERLTSCAATARMHLRQGFVNPLHTQTRTPTPPTPAPAAPCRYAFFLPCPDCWRASLKRVL